QHSNVEFGRTEECKLRIDDLDPHPRMSEPRTRVKVSVQQYRGRRVRGFTEIDPSKRSDLVAQLCVARQRCGGVAQTRGYRIEVDAIFGLERDLEDVRVIQRAPCPVFQF